MSKALEIPNSVSFAANSITLPTSLSNFEDITITWSSNSELINVTTGVVNHSTENMTVVLTATLSKGTTNYEVVFEVVVQAADNKEYEVLATLDLEDAADANQFGNSETKPGYAEAKVELGTPKATWLMRNALIAATSSDKYEGKMAIRAQAGQTAAETARIEIQKDDEYNVVEFAAAIYGKDASGIQIKIEYSLDSGTTWLVSEEIVTVTSSTLEIYRIKLPEGVKRIAIVVVENTGRRVNIDNIKLMK